MKKKLPVFAPSGFTLVELLITVTIIAVLAAVGIVSYMAFLRQTRDTARQSDLKTIQSVLEQYHADQHFYPPSQLNFTGQRFTDATGRTAAPVTKVYLNNTPKEQGQSNPYLYIPLPAGCSELGPPLCSDYCLYARLEGTSPTLGNCSVQSNYNYAVSQP